MKEPVNFIQNHVDKNYVRAVLNTSCDWSLINLFVVATVKPRWPNLSEAMFLMESVLLPLRIIVSNFPRKARDYSDSQAFQRALFRLIAHTVLNEIVCFMIAEISSRANRDIDMFLYPTLPYVVERLTMPQLAHFCFILTTANTEETVVDSTSYHIDKMVLSSTLPLRKFEANKNLFLFTECARTIGPRLLALAAVQSYRAPGPIPSPHSLFSHISVDNFQFLSIDLVTSWVGAFEDALDARRGSLEAAAKTVVRAAVCPSDLSCTLCAMAILAGGVASREYAWAYLSAGFLRWALCFFAEADINPDGCVSEETDGAMRWQIWDEPEEVLNVELQFLRLLYFFLEFSSGRVDNGLFYSPQELLLMGRPLPENYASRGCGALPDGRGLLSAFADAYMQMHRINPRRQWMSLITDLLVRSGGVADQIWVAARGLLRHILHIIIEEDFAYDDDSSNLFVLQPSFDMAGVLLQRNPVTFRMFEAALTERGICELFRKARRRVVDATVFFRMIAFNFEEFRAHGMYNVDASPLMAMFHDFTGLLALLWHAIPIQNVRSDSICVLNTCFLIFLQRERAGKPLDVQLDELVSTLEGLEELHAGADMGVWDAPPGVATLPHMAQRIVRALGRWVPQFRGSAAVARRHRARILVSVHTLLQFWMHMYISRVKEIGSLQVTLQIPFYEFRRVLGHLMTACDRLIRDSLTPEQVRRLRLRDRVGALRGYALPAEKAEEPPQPFLPPDGALPNIEGNMFRPCFVAEKAYALDAGDYMSNGERTIRGRIMKDARKRRRSGV